MGQSWHRYTWRSRHTDRRVPSRVPSEEFQFQISSSHNFNCHVRMVPLLLFMASGLIIIDSLISVVGFLDSIVAAKQNSARFGYSISPNRELVALGAANLAGSFVPGTLPAFGSITRYCFCYSRKSI